MADKIRIGYFLEDRGHEIILKSFVARVAKEKGLYKSVMRDAIASSDIIPQFGGYEYGEKIVEAMDLYSATKSDASLKHFIDDLADVLTRIILQRD